MTKSTKLLAQGSFDEVLALSLNLPRFFDQAACHGQAPEIFDGETLSAVLEAKQICSDCPIQALCLDWATQTQDAGVWGGLTPQERKKQGRGTNPVDIGELRWLETNRGRLLSETSAAKLAAEFEVTERTIYRWRKKMQLQQIAS
jgi:WhiB family redox-sensing transcriptional regulator